MRPVYLFLLLAGAGIIAWLVVARPKTKAETPKQQAIAVSKHSDGFNKALDQLIGVYSLMGEDLIKWDSLKVRDKAADINVRLTDFKLDDLKKDSAIYLTAQGFVEGAKGEAQTIADETAIRPQREAYNRLTDNLVQLLNTVNYDREKLFLQECPMAFDETKAAQWLSRKEEIRNPYLGLYHPRYGKGMLACGETKQTINHTGKD